MSDNTYFAAKEPKDAASILMSKADDWFRELDTNGYLDKLRVMWASYYNAYYTDIGDSHTVTFSGEQGELVQISVNHLRNLAQHMLVMITGSRPALQARAINTDYKSLTQARLANGILEYYMREKRLEVYLKKAVESAIVLGSGYIKVEWNANLGETYDIDDDEETGETIEVKEGDLIFSNLSPFDVIFDPNREDNDHDWVLCRSFKNRHDMIAQYPEHKDRIEALPSKADLQTYHLESAFFDETELIPIYEFYHKETESMVDGRYILFLDSEVVLLDSPMPYKNLPVYRIAPSDIMGTPYGYTPLFDVLPVQDAINSLYSTILTNQNAFGVQNILVPRGADVGISELSGGLNVIEANTQYGPIQPLNLTNTPEEVFKFLGMLEQVSETLSGVSSVTRGNPETSLKSGTALAMVQSTSLQFMSGLQQSYVQLIEDIGTGIVNILKDFAKTPRMAAIAGVNNRTEMKQFSGNDLSNVNRVIVDIGNPLARTTAGRVEMAEQLLQMGAITTPEQYFTVINTGRLEPMMENTQSELDLIRAENEDLMAGKEVIAVPTDQHTMHIREHKAVIADPELRKDPALLKRTLDHIYEHIEMLRTQDADLLSMINEQPLGPAGGSPAGQPGPQMPPDASMQGQAPETLAPQGSVPQAGQGNMPEVPRPPAPFENAPISPDEIPNQ